MIPLKIRIGLTLGFGLVLVALLFSLSAKFFDPAKLPNSPSQLVKTDPSVAIRDETFLIRQQMSERMQQKINAYLSKTLGVNRSVSQVTLELDPLSRVVLLTQVSLSLDGEGKYDRDASGQAIGGGDYTECSQPFLNQIETSVEQILRLSPSRGDRVEVHCFNFSTLVKK